jgi:hypothetical protein
MSALLLLVAVACQYYAVKKLEHGLPVARRGLVNPDMQAIDDEPVLLTDSRTTGISIHNLGLQQPQQLQQRRLAPSACYYEVTLSGFGLDVEGAVHVYSARHLITPFHFGLRDPDRSSSSASDQQHRQEGAGAQPRARGGIVVRSVDTGTQAVSSSSAEGVHTPRVEMSVRGPEEAYMYLELFAAADVVTSYYELELTNGIVTAIRIGIGL